MSIRRGDHSYDFWYEIFYHHVCDFLSLLNFQSYAKIYTAILKHIQQLYSICNRSETSHLYGNLGNRTDQELQAASVLKEGFDSIL